MKSMISKAAALLGLAIFFGCASSDVREKRVTEAEIREFCGTFCVKVMQRDLKGTLDFFEPDYVDVQHDKMLKGNTEQFIEEFLSGEMGNSYYTPKISEIRSLEVVDVSIQEAFGVEYWAAAINVVLKNGRAYVVYVSLFYSPAYSRLFFQGAVG